MVATLYNTTSQLSSILNSLKSLSLSFGHKHWHLKIFDKYQHENFFSILVLSWFCYNDALNTWIITWHELWKSGFVAVLYYLYEFWQRQYRYSVVLRGRTRFWRNGYVDILDNSSGYPPSRSALVFDEDTGFRHISQSKNQTDFLIDNSC